MLAEGAKDKAEQFAKDHEFKAFKGADVNRAAWVKALKPIPREQWPPWVSLRDEWPKWAKLSQVTIVPFYDRTGLIYETLGTLNDALGQEILITFIVVVLMVMHLRSSVLIGMMLPLAVMLCFVTMKTFHVDANIVALSGIAIAIGTIVDMGIVVCENILRHLDEAPPEAPRLEVVHRAASEVGGAVLTAVATTIISFLPVFFMIGQEGKLFKPLAFTKSFALLASVVIALTVLPPAAHIIFCGRIRSKMIRAVLHALIAAAGVGLGIYGITRGSGLIIASGAGVLLMGLHSMFSSRLPKWLSRLAPWAANAVVVVLLAYVLSIYWQPLGPELGKARNFGFVAGMVGTLLGFFRLFQLAYPWLLRLCLAHKWIFSAMSAVVLVLGASPNEQASSNVPNAIVTEAARPSVL
ncbi:hypothetical protein LCGC14_2210620, partial [marine sediment metagenome]